MNTELEKKIEQFADLEKYYKKKAELKLKEMEVFKDGKGVDAYNRNRCQAEEYSILLKYLTRLKMYDDALNELILMTSNHEAVAAVDLNWVIKFIRERINDER